MLYSLRASFLSPRISAKFSREKILILLHVSSMRDIYQFRKPFKCRNGAVLNWFPLPVIICDLVFGAFGARIYRTYCMTHFD